jgi:hypothetical protein
MTTKAPQHLAEKSIELTTYASGGTTFIGSFMGFLNEYAAAFGVIFTFVALCVNIAYKEYYRRKSLKDEDK